MRRHLRVRVPAGAAWLLAGLLTLFLIIPGGRVLMWAILELLFPAATLAAAILFLGRLAAPARRCLRDEFEEKEVSRKKRLAQLRAHQERLLAALRDIQELAPRTGADGERARQAEEALRRALEHNRREIADERAALFFLQATRWLAQVEPLLPGMERLDEAGIQDWLGRLTAIRAQGQELLLHLRSEPEVKSRPAGLATEELIQEALEEMEALRVELLTRRAHLLASLDPASRPALPADDASATLERLKAVLNEARARWEVESWLAER